METRGRFLLRTALRRQSPAEGAGFSHAKPFSKQPGHRDGKLADESGDAGTDVYGHSGRSFPPLEIGVLPVQAGTTSEQWSQPEAQKTTFPDCQVVSTMDKIRAAGEEALEQHIHCQSATITNIFLVHGTQGYLIS